MSPAAAAAAAAQDGSAVTAPPLMSQSLWRCGGWWPCRNESRATCLIVRLRMEEGQGRGYVPKDLRFSMVDIRSCVVVESLGGFGGNVRRGCRGGVGAAGGVVSGEWRSEVVVVVSVLVLVLRLRRERKGGRSSGGNLQHLPRPLRTLRRASQVPNFNLSHACLLHLTLSFFSLHDFIFIFIFILIFIFIFILIFILILYRIQSRAYTDSSLREHAFTVGDSPHHQVEWFCLASI